MKLKRVLVVYAKPNNKIQRDTLKTVKKTLSRHEICCDISVREKLKKGLFRNKDLIVAVGGDGTFLMASHFVFSETPILGVNSDPDCKEGFFMESGKKDFEKKLKKIIRGDYKLKKLHRLEAYIGNKKIPELALNEFLIAAEKAYQTVRYYFTLRGKRERQKSSGILVATASGTHAWVKSAGGKQLPMESEKFEYLIREPYCGRTASKCTMHNGILGKKERIVVEFEVGTGIVVADSTGKENKFKAGQKVTIKRANKPIHSLTYKK